MLLWLFVLSLLPPSSLTGSEEYFPPPDRDGGWRTLKDAKEIRSVAGIDLARLDQAFEFEKRPANTEA
jgi:hypothetical protein